MQIDTLTSRTHARLKDWGRSIRGGRENLLYPSINVISPDHVHSIGAKHVLLSAEVWETEEVIAEIHKEAPVCASVLRAYYLVEGPGESKRRMAEKFSGCLISRYYFGTMFKMSFDVARWYFEILAKWS